MANGTEYHIAVRLPGELRPWTVEGEIPTTKAEALKAIDQLPNGWGVARVLQIDADDCVTNVTDELWADAVQAWKDGGGDADNDPVPQFILDHAPLSFYTGYRGTDREGAAA